jgi:hypothetical protein
VLVSHRAGFVAMHDERVVGDVVVVVVMVAIAVHPSLFRICCLVV